jgi:hypothetical protein
MYAERKPHPGVATHGRAKDPVAQPAIPSGRAARDLSSLADVSPRLAAQRRIAEAIQDAAQLRAGCADAVAPPGRFGQAPIQRAVGFEFESGNKITDAKDPSKNLAKDRVYEAENFRIDADTRGRDGHNIEFVTNAKNTFEEVHAAITEAAGFAKNLVNKPTVDEDDGWKGSYRLNIRNAKWLACVQHTEGVLLTHMHHFLTHSLETAGEETRPVTDLEESHETANVAAKVRGLIQLVMEYLRRLQSWNGKDNEEGPKNAGVIMSRTDFHSIYNTLTPAEKTAFAQRIFVDLKNAHIAPAQPLFKYPYLQYLGGEQPERTPTSFTVGAWITSIMEGTKLQDGTVNPKDLLSPPEGYEEFDPEYSMGAMGMDGDRVIIEVRKYGDMADALEVDLWSGAPQMLLSEQALAALGFDAEEN